MDYAAGSAGFLISSMKLMIKDAEERITSPEELNRKIAIIKYEQLLGIEKRADIYASCFEYDTYGRWLLKYYS